jgi:hypothetical protein
MTPEENWKEGMEKKDIPVGSYGSVEGIALGMGIFGRSEVYK